MKCVGRKQSQQFCEAHGWLRANVKKRGTRNQNRWDHVDDGSPGGTPDARLLEVPPDARPKLLVGLAIEMVHRRRDRFVDGDEEVLERGAEGFGGHGAHGLRWTSTGFGSTKTYHRTQTNFQRPTWKPKILKKVWNAENEPSDMRIRIRCPTMGCFTTSQENPLKTILEN